MSNDEFVKENADHSLCKWSSGINESLIVDQGYLSEYGYWSRPCYFCARREELRNPEKGPIWPFNRECLIEGQ